MSYERHRDLALEYQAAGNFTAANLHHQAANAHNVATRSPAHAAVAAAATTMAMDAGWEEGKHPRSDDGKFGPGGGGKKPAEGKSYADHMKDASAAAAAHKAAGGGSKAGGASEIHRAGKFSVRHDPVRKKKGLPSYAVFEDGNAKAHSAHHDEGEAKAAAEKHHTKRRYESLMEDYKKGTTSELSDQERSELRKLHALHTGENKKFPQFNGKPAPK